MQQAPAISRSSLGRTLGAAGWILGIAALVEIIAAGTALVKRSHHGQTLARAGIAAQSNIASQSGIAPQPPATAGHPQQLALTDPFATESTSTPAPKPLAQPTPAPALSKPAPTARPAPALAKPAPTQMASTLPKPTPVEERQVMPESRVDGLVAESRALRARGDTSTAVTRLREAAAISPKNPLVISELAETYEKMDLEDKALDQWRTIYDMGDSAGIYYQAADAKLKAAQLAQGSPATSTSAPAGDNSSVSADANGFQPGSVLALMNLSTVEKPETSDGFKRFTLKIPVKRRPDAKIDVPNVVIQVFLFDQLGDNTIVHTNADVSSHWSTLPADWQAEDIEILDVDYTQAPPEPGKIEEGRHYYGYVVCIYYNKELQDQAADPQGLIKKFPPPLTLPDKQ
ncbi:MAG TPA: hypothetical protein VHY22_14605 [Chthoniobacteraceae bacterium]|nr:hypothetical protein [Chthoniobacteraceae bacterium]